MKAFFIPVSCFSLNRNDSRIMKFEQEFTKISGIKFATYQKKAGEIIFSCFRLK